MSEALKTFITVTDMARAVGLSKSRFYSLIGSTFPSPTKSPYSNRPYYDEEGQRQCLIVRKNNCGVNGEPIFFQNKTATSYKKVANKSSKTSTKKYDSLIETLSALGLNGVTDKQIEAVISANFTEKNVDLDDENVIRAIFIAISTE